MINLKQRYGDNMNKETFVEIISSKKYDMYNYWERCENNLKDEIDMLISYYQKELAIENAKLCKSFKDIY